MMGLSLAMGGTAGVLSRLLGLGGIVGLPGAATG